LETCVNISQPTFHILPELLLFCLRHFGRRSRGWDFTALQLLDGTSNDSLDSSMLIRHVDSVKVETRYELTLEWMDEQIGRVGEALELATARYRDLGGL
jgi:hypothetical protein